MSHIPRKVSHWCWIIYNKESESNPETGVCLQNINKQCLEKQKCEPSAAIHGKYAAITASWRTEQWNPVQSVRMSATRKYYINPTLTTLPAVIPDNSSNHTTTSVPADDNFFVSGLMMQSALLLVVFGNLLVLLALYSYKRWTAPDVLVFSLSLADLLDSLIGLQTSDCSEVFPQDSLARMAL